MQRRRWINQSQPQTLVIAVFLLYISSAFTLLFGLGAGYPVVFGTGATLLLLRLLLGACGIASGYGIANEQRWAYQLGVAVAAAPLAVLTYVCARYQINPLRLDLIPLMFDIALFALLVHPMSREYQRLWFNNPGRRTT